MLLGSFAAWIYRSSRLRLVAGSNHQVVNDHHLNFKHQPSVTIIVPTRDNYLLLRTCIESIITTTTYINFEILIVDNDSKEPDCLEYLSSLNDEAVKVIKYPHKFNFSRICNYAITLTKSEYVLLLNNDTEITHSDWLQNMIQHAQQPGVGIVGSTLLFPNGTIQHVGIAMGLNGIAGHPYAGHEYKETKLRDTTENCRKTSGVTFACALFSRQTWEKLGGLDEKLMVGLNDVDFCLTSRKYGLDVICCSRSVLVHAESATRPKARSFRGFLGALFEIRLFLSKWPSAYFEENYFKLTNR